jgi:hypothetical protein
MRVLRSLLKGACLVVTIVLVLSLFTIGVMLRPRNDTPRRLTDHAEKVVSLSPTRFPLFAHLYRRHLWLSNDTLLIFAKEGNRAQPVRLTLRDGIAKRLPCEGLPIAAMGEYEPLLTESHLLLLSPDNRFLLGVSKPNKDWTQAGVIVLPLNPPGKLIQSPVWQVELGGRIHHWLPGNQGWITFNPDFRSGVSFDPNHPTHIRRFSRFEAVNAMGGGIVCGVRNDGTVVSVADAGKASSLHLIQWRIGESKPRASVQISHQLERKSLLQPLSLSPDGSRILWQEEIFRAKDTVAAFVLRLREFNPNIFPNYEASSRCIYRYHVSDVNSGVMRLIPGAEGESDMLSPSPDIRWTPDGKYISFFAEGAIWRLPVP